MENKLIEIKEFNVATLDTNQRAELCVVEKLLAEKFKANKECLINGNVDKIEYKSTDQRIGDWTITPIKPSAGTPKSVLNKQAILNEFYNTNRDVFDKYQLPIVECFDWKALEKDEWFINNIKGNQKFYKMEMTKPTSGSVRVVKKENK